MIDTTLAWLATYLIHSTVLILGVWAFNKWWALDSLTRSLLWKLALVGGLFTATLQTGFGVQPALGQFALVSPPPPVVIEEAPEFVPVVELEEAIEEESSVVVVEVEDGAQSVTIVSMIDAGPAWAPMPSPPPPPPMAAAPPMPPLQQDEEDGGVPAALVGLFLGGAALGLGRLLVTARRLRRLLAGRGDVTRGPLAERLAALLVRARVTRRSVRLTLSPALISPIALASREIVVPEAALDLEARQQEAMLAHELAHVVRNDPAWLVLAAVLEAALFVQPLNRIARAGMQEAAEELADDWAVRLLGTGLHLARCLTEVAGWQGRGRVPGAFVSPMASGDRSALVTRVQRLIGDGRGEVGRWTMLRRALAAAGLLAAVTLGAPGMAVAQASPTLTDMPEPPAPPPMPEVMPVLAFADGAPLLAMRDDRSEDDGKPAPTLRERRMLRRADRLERRATKAGAKAARLRGEDGEHVSRREVVVVGPREVHVDNGDGGHVVIVHSEDGERGHRQSVVPRGPRPPGHARVHRGPMPPGHVRMHRGPHMSEAEIEALREAGREAGRAARGFDQAEVQRLREEARELARAAQGIDQVEIQRLREEAREVAREARGVRFPDPAEIEALQRQAEALARQAPHLSAEAIADLQRQAARMAEHAPRFDAEQMRRLERDLEAAVRRNLPDERALEEQVRRGLPDPQAIEDAVRRSLERSPGLSDEDRQRIGAEVRRELDKLGKDRDRAGKDREKAREQAEKAREQAEKQRDKAYERADKDREKQREQAEKQRDKAREKADKAREKAEKRREKADRKP